MDINASLGYSLINRSVGQFEKIANDLEKGIEYCRKAIVAKNEKKDKLTAEIKLVDASIDEDQSTIKKAEKFKAKIVDILN